MTETENSQAGSPTLWSLLISILAVGWFGCGGDVHHEAVPIVAVARVVADDQLIAVPPPPFSEDMFPCAECHEGEEVNRTRRFIEDHDDVVLNHDSDNRWCLDCHDADEVEDTEMMKRSDAFHEQCIRCHQDFDAGPVACAACHVVM